MKRNSNVGYMDVEAVERQIQKDGRTRQEIGEAFGCYSGYLSKVIGMAKAGAIPTRVISTVEAMLGVPTGSFRKTEVPEPTESNEQLLNAVIELVKIQKEMAYEVMDISKDIRQMMDAQHMKDAVEKVCAHLKRIENKTEELHRQAITHGDNVENKLEEIRSTNKGNSNYNFKTKEAVEKLVGEFSNS